MITFQKKPLSWKDVEHFVDEISQKHIKLWESYSKIW